MDKYPTLKYKFFDEVFIKPLGIMGKITGWHEINGGLSVYYHVSYHLPTYSDDPYFLISEYSGNLHRKDNFSEKDLELVSSFESKRLPEQTFFTELRICDHSWKTYEGFTFRYEYCEKCDVKK